VLHESELNLITAEPPTNNKESPSEHLQIGLPKNGVSTGDNQILSQVFGMIDGSVNQRRKN
jgi:hypothetical protein